MVMKAMRLVDIGKPLRLFELDVPKPKDYEVLVKVKAVGVCRSDLHLKSGYIGKLNIIKDLNIKLPITPGHEIVGIIEDYGDKVPSVFNKGDKVLIYPWQGDGICRFCRVGDDHLCDNFKHLGINVDGGYAEYVLVSHYKYLYKFNYIDFIRVAPIPCAGVTALRAVKRGRPSSYSNVLVVGSGGGVGHLIVQILKKLFNCMVVGVEITKHGIEYSRLSSADYVVNGSNIDEIIEALKEYFPTGVDLVFDTVCNDFTLGFYPKFLSKSGKYILIGVYGGDLKINSTLPILNENEFIGVHIGNQKDFYEVLRLVENNVLQPLISKTYKLEEVNEALDNLEAYRVAGRQVIIV